MSGYKHVGSVLELKCGSVMATLVVECEKRQKNGKKRKSKKILLV